MSGVIPIPTSWTRQHGHCTLDQATPVRTSVASEQLEDAAEYLRDWIAGQSGGDGPRSGRSRVDLGLEEALGAEAYSLRIERDAIMINGGDPAGVFYGLQTLIQLTNPWEGHPGGELRVPCGELEDGPAFPYRGMHLDVGRHLFPVSFIKQYIDLMARYKMNRFHWHLTEDQGWRIEIQRYPRLQEVAAFRKETLIGHLKDQPHRYDGQPYGGYYTQAEIREVVAHARKRFVEVIPEIEMPGHAQAAIAAYPELGCVDKPLEVATKWGIFDNVFCPTERTFDFLEGVLTEVMNLFPSPYLHIGGDECPKEQWKSHPACRQIIRENRLKDEYELQSFFIRRIEAFLFAHGRKLIGWDEILEGGLAPHATVMSWRGEAGGIEAAKMGHDVIMTPNDHCYFDLYQAEPAGEEPLAIGGFLPLEKVFHYRPVPPSLSEAEAAHILGAQGNVWTEYMPTPEQVEYMVYPRMLALSEVVWRNGDKRDFDDFSRRVKHHLRWLRGEGVHTADHLLRS